MDASWDVYISHMLPKPALVRVNVALAPIAPIKTHPFSIVCSTDGLPVTEALLPTDASMKRIALFEAKTEALIQGKAVYVGRISFDKLTAFTFYGPNDGSLIETFKTSSELNSIAPFTCTGGDDHEWRRYIVGLVHMAPTYRNNLANSRARNDLAADGDDGVSKREVQHRAHFWTADDRSKYIALLKNEGYTIVYSPDSNAQAVWSVAFIKEQSPSTIEFLTQGLMQKAAELNGNYDGWKSLVVNAPD